MRPASLLSLLVLLSLGVTARSEPMTVHMLVYPNAGLFEVTDGQLTGPGATMLDRLQSLSQVRMTQQVVPIARALQMAQLQPGICAVAVPRTPDRESQFRWTVPWASSAMAVFARAADPRQVRSAADLRGARLAVLRDSVPAAWVKEQGLNAYEVNETGIGLRMLAAERVDYWVGNELATQYAMRGWPGTLPKALYTFGRVDLPMGCHPATPSGVVERLNAALEHMRRDGELAAFGLR
ncbi:substrate-binding periplasmic protein [Roseateles sp. BYS87W]|uniref:Substrate-binding periplasmic protein n=1 Tax=Pelomonas baiyunensis TaxID=3299026 RepID=A0ABW7GVQ6_9BURK